MADPAMNKQSNFQPAEFKDKVLREKFSTAIGKLAVGATVVFFGYMILVDHRPSAPEKPVAEFSLKP